LASRTKANPAAGRAEPSGVVELHFVIVEFQTVPAEPALAFELLLAFELALERMQDFLCGLSRRRLFFGRRPGFERTWHEQVLGSDFFAVVAHAKVTEVLFDLTLPGQWHFQ
jgi:hypothetical protein